MIEHVGCVQPELKALCLADPHLLRDVAVKPPASRAKRGAHARSAPLSRPRVRENNLPCISIGDGIEGTCRIQSVERCDGVALRIANATVCALHEVNAIVGTGRERDLTL